MHKQNVQAVLLLPMLDTSNGVVVSVLLLRNNLWLIEKILFEECLFIFKQKYSFAKSNIYVTFYKDTKITKII